MAKKINVKLILELRSAGMGRNAIATSRHISKNSVGDVFHIADRMGISYEDIAQMDEDAVYRKFYPDKFALENLYDKPDYEYVHQELKRTGVTLKLLWQEYQDSILMILKESNVLEFNMFYSGECHLEGETLYLCCDDDILFRARERGDQESSRSFFKKSRIFDHIKDQLP